MAKKIIIYNQLGYCGGAIALSVLCKTFRDLGYDARVMFNYYNNNGASCNQVRRKIGLLYYQILQLLANMIIKKIPFINILQEYILPANPLTQMPNIKIQYNPFFNRKNTIVIYPELVYGNPLSAKHVMRWLLSFYKYEEVKGAFRETDFFVCYRHIFNSYKLNPDCIHLQTSFFDNTLYKRYNYEKRNGTCYIVYKGKNRKDLPKHFDGPYFDNNMTQEELVKMFNEHEYCYSYDTQSFYNIIASVCGCKTIVVMEPGKQMEDYLGKGEREHYGIAYGDTPEQIEYAEKTRDRLIAKLNEINDKNVDSLKRFIPILERRFGALKRLK